MVVDDGGKAGNHFGRAHLGLSSGTIADVLKHVEVPEPAGPTGSRPDGSCMKIDHRGEQPLMSRSPSATQRGITFGEALKRRADPLHRSKGLRLVAVC